MMQLGEHLLSESGPLQTVLVVEDEVLIRMAIADYLRDCLYRVLEASNGKEAIDILNVEPSIDIIFSDVQMPLMDGFELANWARRERPGVRVILTSGGVKAGEAAKHLCESDPLVAKPYQLADIVARIRMLLAQ